MDGDTVDISTRDGVADAYLSRPPGQNGSHPGVLFIMDAFGLRPRIEEMAECEEERHADRCRDRSNGFNQAAVGVAAKGDLFGKCGDSEGDKVKASLRFKGRQMAHRDLGYKIINRLILDIGDAGLVEFMPRMEGTTLHAILAPSKKAESAPKKPEPASAASANKTSSSATPATA